MTSSSDDKTSSIERDLNSTTTTTSDDDAATHYHAYTQTSDSDHSFPSERYRSLIIFTPFITDTREVVSPLGLFCLSLLLHYLFRLSLSELSYIILAKLINSGKAICVANTRPSWTIYLCMLST